MAGKSSRTKGAAAEREVCQIIRDILLVDVNRNLDQTRDGGNDIDLGKYKLEIKRQETLALPTWCRQVELACNNDEIPVVVYRTSREPWRVVLPLEEFLLLLKANNDNRHC